MKLAFYLGTRKPWYIGLGNRLVRLRLRSQISHCELVFEPGDGVEDLMPSGRPSDALWCAGSSASDVMPAWSPRRAGRHGGVRFKAIDVRDESKWLLVDLPRANSRAAAEWFVRHQGELYDWQGIFGFLAWVVPQNANRWSCHEACGAAIGIKEPHRLDPASLAQLAQWTTRGD